MKRKLLLQIKNEWRDNVWMILELMIVTGVMCMVFLAIYANVKDYFLPRGFDYENVYTMGISVVVEKSPYHVQTTDSDENPYQEDLYGIISRLKMDPNVEAVAIHQNGLPYNYNFSGQNLYKMNENDTVGYYGNVRTGTPGIVKVLRIESLTGKSTEELESMLERGELLISNNTVSENNGVNVMDLIGQQVILDRDSSQIYRVGDVIRKVRRTDYEDSWGGTIIVPMDEKQCWGNLMLRIKPGHDMRFKEAIRNNAELRKQRNVYFSRLNSLSDIRKSCQRALDNNLHVMVCLVLFLLLTIFLGLSGTFWFRIQQRVGEIALRKVCGGTKGDIFRRVLSEGMILLLIAAVFISLIIWPLSGVIKSFCGCSAGEILLFELVAIAVVALGIVVSLWQPARRAMKIEPAIALKSE